MYNIEQIIAEKYLDGVIDDDHFVALLEKANKSDKTIKLTVIPTKRVGDIKFGMSRNSVRKILNINLEEFKKTPSSKNTTDDFGFCHVFYDESDKCEAIEIHGDVIVELNGQKIYPNNFSVLEGLINDFEKEDNDYISVSKSIGVSVSSENKNIKSILFGKQGYYNN